MARKIVLTSGKGGVGKTTVCANLGICLAKLGFRVVLMDVDIGLNNLDVVMGVENQVVFDITDVIMGKCRPKQALVQDRNISSLYVLPSAQAYNKTNILGEHIKNVVDQLDSSFDYDGTTYILNSAQQDYVEGNKITHKFGHNITEYNVYYTEKGVEINSYEVSITYMDVSHTNVGEKTLYTTKVTANVNEALSIDVEQQFQANGTTYVLLPGQESHYDHDFYSTRRNYVMVYRDINDTNNDIVLNPIVANNTSEMAVTLQGTNANGTAITIEGTTGNPIMNNPDGSITTVDPDGNIVPYQEEETEIIEEEQTPLVNGKENQVNNSNETLFIAGGIVLVIIIAGLIYGIKTKKLIKFKNHS